MLTLNKQAVPHHQDVPEKVLQFGEGNFMRGFVDWMIHEMNKKTDFGGSVIAVQPIAEGMAETLNRQDGCYTLYLQGMKDGAAVREHEVITSISRAIDPYADFDSYMETASIESLRFIFSNTTEAGITFDPSDRLDSRPQHTFPGKLTAWLYRRYQVFKGRADKGLIIIPCELIDRNGEKLKEAVMSYIELWHLEQGFKEWVLSANTFCCSLVDRIVPGYPKDTIDEITDELGYVDRLVVVGEQFHLWVIEGPDWIADELPAAAAGLNVLVTDDMTPYRTRKVRILNGAHTAMMPVAYLYGLDTVGEAIQHQLIGRYVRELLDEEIIPTLDLLREELESFAEAVIDRFRNPFVQHYLMSISLNSMSKFKARDLPSLLEYVNRQQQIPRRLSFALAALIVFYRGLRGEEPVQVADDAPILAFYQSLWEKWDGSTAGTDQLVKAVLGNETLWGMNLNDVLDLTAVISCYVNGIIQHGMQAAIQQLMHLEAGSPSTQKGW